MTEGAKIKVSELPAADYKYMINHHACCGWCGDPMTEAKDVVHVLSKGRKHRYYHVRCFAKMIYYDDGKSL